MIFPSTRQPSLPRRESGLLPLALGASIAVHAWILGLQAQAPSISPADPAAISVRIQAARPAREPTPEPPASRTGDGKRAAARPRRTTATESPRATPTESTARKAASPALLPQRMAASRTAVAAVPEADADPPVPAPRSAPAPLEVRPSKETVSAALRQSIAARLRLQLARHFRYPLLARKRGIQGTVLLEIVVCADGRICDRKLLKSSGHRILDRAALEAASKIRRTPLERPLPERLALQVPVIYRLRGG